MTSMMFLLLTMGDIGHILILVKEAPMQIFCCKFHLTGGDQSAPCEDRDLGQIIVGDPLGPDEDVDSDDNDETD
jgi:hypothetical protein